MNKVEMSATKQALAEALKELMCEQDFRKITIADICGRCQMHRKSFYYHFHDKYELVNWIFDVEIVAATSVGSVSDTPGRWDFAEQICGYLYENRSFYRAALRIQGQNSFTDHFRQCITPALRTRLADVLGEGNADAFYVDFFTDAMLCAIGRWLFQKECMPPQIFLKKMKHLVQHAAWPATPRSADTAQESG